MKINGFIETSFVDWDGKISSVIFLPTCNFRCGFCHNSALVLGQNLNEVPFSKIKHFLKMNKGWIDGICITGGEPTLHADLPELCKKIKDLGFGVKLDSNGTNPNMLKTLIKEKLIDFIAMDIKAPLEEQKYMKVAGMTNKTLFKNILESIKVISSSGLDYEFRTTVVPGIHTRRDIADITQYLKGSKKYVIQNFRPGICLDESFNNLKSFTDKELRQFKYVADENIVNVLVRK